MDLLQSNNLDDIILGLAILDKPLARNKSIKVNYSNTVLIVFPNVIYLIYNNTLQIFLNKYVLDIDELMKIYIQANYIVKDLR